VLPTAGCVALALALAGITLGARPRVVILLDFSGSTRQSPWRDPGWVHGLAQRRLEPGQRLTVVAFAGDQKRVLLPDITPADNWPALFDWDAPPAPPGAGTDIAAALALPPGEHAARWVITDGLFPASAIPVDERIAWTIVAPAAPDAAVRDILLRAAPEGRWRFSCCSASLGSRIVRRHA